MELDESLDTLQNAGYIIEKTFAPSNEWNFIVCPTDIAKKVLEDAGYDYDGCLLYQGEIAENPYTGRKEKVLTWTTVGYLLKDKGIIDFEETNECIKKIKELVNK
jgi:hypothetical protein